MRVRARLWSGICLGLLLSAGGAGFAQTPRPTRSTAISVTADGSKVWVVNPDSDSVTVMETAGDSVVAEIPVGRAPATLAISPDGARVFVANSDGNDLSVIDTSLLAEVSRITAGVQPFGVALNPAGTRLYVANTNSNTVTVIDPTTLAVIADIPTARRPRGIAVTADGTRILVTHYLTPVPSLNGSISILDGATNTVRAVVALPLLPGLPGVANIIQQLVFRPGSSLAWIPMVQMETGNPNPQLTTTVHPSLAVVDAIAQAEVAPQRTDLNRVVARPVSQPTALDFGPGGAVAFIANMASDDLVILAAATRTEILTLPVGSAPQGVAVTPAGTKAYVSNYLGRSVSVVDISNPQTASVVSTVQVTPEPLPAGIANGKRLFFTSRGRLSQAGWIACISCHPGGGFDARDWNFTRLGEGIRNTTDIRGIVDSGAVHWTANMDELQDLEFNIRNIQFGAGLVSGPPNDPFGPPNAGLSEDLDDFAAFMDSLIKPVRGNPNRAQGGGLTLSAARGKALFESPATGCASCHRGAAFNDSDRASLARHDVGTLAPGDVAGGDGFDTPSLLALFDSPPYLHDGSAPTLLDVITTRNAGNRHGVTSQLTAPQRQDMVAYMTQLDNDRDEMSAGSVTGLPGSIILPLFARDLSLTRLNATDATSGSRIWGFDLSLAFDPTGITGVSIQPAGITAGLPVRSVSDPPADLFVGRKTGSLTFDAPIPFIVNAAAPGQIIASIVFTVGSGAAGPPITLAMEDAGTALRNDTGSKTERPGDGNLLALDGRLTVGTPSVADGSLDSQPLIVSWNAGQVGLSWEPIESGDLPVTYNVYRGGLATLFNTKIYAHSCFMSGLTAPWTIFGDDSADHYYLVSAVAPGFGEGSLGADSAGAAIPNPGACP